MQSSLKSEFSRVWPLLKPALTVHGDTHRKRHVWEALEARKVQLWSSPNAAIVTEIKVFPTGYKHVNGWLTGGNLDEILQLVPQIEAWAKKLGANSIGVDMARPGWARKLPGYSTVSVNVLKDL